MGILGDKRTKKHKKVSKNTTAGNMSSQEYRFLRFEIVGISTLVFLIVGLLPFLRHEILGWTTVDVGTAISIFGALFLASLPLGYWEHQLVVNVYRSPKKRRRAFGVIEKTIKNIENGKLKSGDTGRKAFFDSMNDRVKNAFVTSLLEICIYCKESSIDKDIFDRLTARWSHFYARRAVGSYAPVISFVLFWIAVACGQIFSWSFLTYDTVGILFSAAWWAFIFGFSKIAIDSYARKLWEEINHLETTIVAANLQKVKDAFDRIVSLYMENPELAKEDESYGAAIWKM
jgi:hypothetical protein